MMKKKPTAKKSFSILGMKPPMPGMKPPMKKKMAKGKKV